MPDSGATIFDYTASSYYRHIHVTYVYSKVEAEDETLRLNMAMITFSKFKGANDSLT